MSSYRSRVLVAGGGIAGLEAAIALRDLAGKRVEVEVCSPREDFVYRPYAVGEPYGASHAFRYDLRRLTDRCGADSASTVSSPSTTRGCGRGRTTARRSPMTIWSSPSGRAWWPEPLAP